MSEVGGIYRPSEYDVALVQGEIISGLIQLRPNLETIRLDDIKFSRQVHPFAIVASQSCDLDWDYNLRKDDSGLDEKSQHKLLPNILFCEMTTATRLRGRTDINSSLWSNIKINKNERYHFFQKVLPEQDLLSEGIDELAVDFKRYFTLPSDEVYERIAIGEAQRRCCLDSPYAEHFSTRFAYFLQRVALPEDHFSE